MSKNKARSAVIWSGINILSQQGAGFVISIILARLLVPKDFGTISLLSLFLGISALFVNAGFSAALIQKKETTHVDESTVFWFNISAGLVVTLMLFALSPWIAHLFALPVLIPLTMLMACNIMISATGTVHSTLLTKNLDFKTPMKISVISTLLSGLLGVYMAWAGYGVWALAGQSVASTVLGTAMLWLLSPWRPAFTFSRNSFKQLFCFSGYIFASGLLGTLYHQGYTLLLGKFYGIYELGIYNRANSTQQLPSNIITGILSRVTFPLFSSIHQDKDLLRRGLRLSIRSVMLITTPVMVGLAVVAKPFTLVVFGEQWLPAVPILKVLCGVGLLFPVHLINLSALQAQGHADLFFRLEVMKKTMGTILLILGSFFGVIGIAWSRVIQSFIALIINAHYTQRYLDYGICEQMRDCIPIIILSTIMATVVALVGSLFETTGVVELLLLISFGAVFYLLGNVVLGITAFKEAVRFFKSERMV